MVSQTSSAMMSMGLHYFPCAQLAAGFGEEQLEHGWQEGGREWRECVWAEVMGNRARMGGGSGLLATQTVPQGLSSCWNMLSVLSSRNPTWIPQAMSCLFPMCHY